MYHKALLTSRNILFFNKNENCHSYKLQNPHQFQGTHYQKAAKLHKSPHLTLCLLSSWKHAWREELSSHCPPDRPRPSWSGRGLQFCCSLPGFTQSHKLQMTGMASYHLLSLPGKYWIPTDSQSYPSWCSINRSIPFTAEVRYLAPFYRITERT